MSDEILYETDGSSTGPELPDLTAYSGSEMESIKGVNRGAISVPPTTDDTDVDGVILARIHRRKLSENSVVEVITGRKVWIRRRCGPRNDERETAERSDIREIVHVID